MQAFDLKGSTIGREKRFNLQRVIREKRTLLKKSAIEIANMGEGLDLPRLSTMKAPEVKYSKKVLKDINLIRMNKAYQEASLGN